MDFKVRYISNLFESYLDSLIKSQFVKKQGRLAIGELRAHILKVAQAPFVRSSPVQGFNIPELENPNLQIRRIKAKCKVKRLGASKGYRIHILIDSENKIIIPIRVILNPDDKFSNDKQKKQFANLVVDDLKNQGLF